MSKRLGIKVMMGSRSYGLTPRKQPISFASHRARIFCRPCNTHFKRLEDDTIPLVVPMANGRVFSLGPESQTLLALWAAKTAIALIAEKQELRELVPKTHRDSVRCDARPHANCWVGYVPWDSPPSIFAADNTFNLPGVGPASGYESYTVIFGFKRAAFQVVGLEPLPPGYRVGVAGYAVRQFWPQLPDLVNWPLDGPPATERDIPVMSRFGPLVPL
jgi:hypothetical protein